ncbi:M56 family metallopeptidase [Cohnella terricola]|uniref:M56 family metallopeptidase n=1 Tax=Cohnella terricola TaxID=1289167 RepID=A0A559JIS9_9BACL|nr:M56 family metallopeptidase [Cohnella terricola]TVX99783.1 M56 family metallopeptidase [Cohnella terricola]
MSPSAKLKWIYATMIAFIVLFSVQLAIYLACSTGSAGLRHTDAAYIGVGVVAGYTLIRMIWRIVAQAYLSRRWLGRFRSNQHLKLSRRLAYKYRNLGTEIIVVKDKAFVALSFGLRRPAIVVSSAVLEMFTDDEVKAIVLHEWHHCHNRDNAKWFLARMLTEGFGYLPIMSPVLRYYHTWMELLADRFAIRRMGTELPLASVLLKLSKLGNQRRLAAAVHFGATAMNYRIAQVLDPDKTVKVKVAWVRPLLMSVSMLLLLMLSGDS